MKKILLSLIVVLGVVWQSAAQDGLPQSQNVFDNDLPYTTRANREFQFLAFFITQGVSTNMYPQSSLFNGQLVGRLFGQNSSTTSDSLVSNYAEQRLLPFFIYQPRLFNGRAILRASFEIDWTWGDQAYGLSGNKGSAFSADQVNIQTQNLELELIPRANWAINLGLQRLFDTPYNPYRTMFDKMTTTGYRLAYWGSDAVGVSIRYDGDYQKLKAGYYKLYENNTEINDDVSMAELFYEQKLNTNWNAGASVFYVADRGMGRGGVSVFSQGLNSTLATYNGAFNFDLPTNDYRADVAWLGAFVSRNADFYNDPFQLTAFVNYNLGRVETNDGTGKYSKYADIGGFAANMRAAWRYGQTTNDFLALDFLFTSGDADAMRDSKYTGVVTGNTWGMPGAIFIGSGAYLLFPHGNVVNRFTPVVSDISNMGYGVTGATFTASRDVVPNKINLRLGSAFAQSSVAPQNGGSFMGFELNGSVRYSFGPFMSLELHAANLWLGDFFDSNDDSHGSEINGNFDSRPVNPWTVFIAYKWLLF